MRCPFLKETRVGQCSRSAPRTMIARPTAATEKCSSAAYVSCSVYREQHFEAAAGTCPFLRESQVQYCSAAPVKRFIPLNDSPRSRCASDAHRYCDLYLELANAAAGSGGRRVRDMFLPGHLLYSPNHMWFDPGAGGTWHSGIDAFAAKVLHVVESVSFVTPPGLGRPTAALTAHGAELQIVFPFPLPITATHDYVRARPEALTEDPYGQGWLFEGSAAVAGPLLDCEAASEWTRREVDRLSEFVATRPAGANPAHCADGGYFADDILAHLGREETLRLFHEFFSPELKLEARSS